MAAPDLRPADATDTFTALIVAAVSDGVRQAVADDGFPPVFDVPTAARYLQVSQQTVYRAIQAGILPALRVGREYRLSRAKVDAALAGERP